MQECFPILPERRRPTISEQPDDLRYAPTHEWARLEDDGSVTVGISDHAQAALGDLVFVETPPVDEPVTAGQPCAVVESVKAASDLYAPISGLVIDTNARLGDEPELVNSDPYGAGWIMRIKPDDENDLGDLLDAEAYNHQLQQDADD